MKFELLPRSNPSGSLRPGGLQLAIIEIEDGDKGPHIVCSGPGHFEADSIVKGCLFKLTNELGREPTAEELAKEMQESEHGQRLRAI